MWLTNLLKKIIYTGIYLILTIQIWFLDTTSNFEEKAKEAWINLEYIKKQNTISRYDVTRLLNAVECVDCISPNNNIIDKYSNSFWQKFITLPWKDFDDIFYKKAIYNNQSYYYCVATVADKEYMFWYPILTSPLCPWEFCGSNNMSKWEFIQVITNILSKYIEKNYTTNWKDIENRYNKQKPWTYSYNIFNERDKAIITNKAEQCSDNNCPMGGTSEFRTYLKYCMFNIDSCKMKEYSRIIQWYWPISELNVALKENIIDYNESFINTIHKPIDWKTAVDAFWRIFSKVQCNFNNDYDCDWIKNQEDNCPNHYNPSQKDTDSDKIGDVCDDDIDWDWIKNPIWIVDERWGININIRNTSTDNCLFIQNSTQIDSNNNYQWDVCDLSNMKGVSIGSSIIWTWEDAKIYAYIITSYKPIENDRKRSIDWKKFSWKEIYFPIKKSWTYELYVQSWVDPKRKASQNIIIEYNKWYIWSNISLNLSKDYIPTILNVKVDKTGNWNKILWNLEWSESQTKTTENNVNQIPFLIRKKWLYKITATIKNKNNETISVASRSFEIKDEWNIIENVMINKIKASVWEQITISSKEKLKQREVNRWDQKKQQENRNNISHTYEKEWFYVISSSITLEDNTIMNDYKTIEITKKQKQSNKSLEYTPTNIETKINNNMEIIWKRIWYNKDEILKELFYDWLKIYTWDNNSINSNTPWIYHIEKKEILWICKMVTHQSTIVIHTNEFSCIEMKINNQKPQCDLDLDWIDDRCDDDIDWDWVKNPIGLVLENHSSCDINKAIIDKSKFDSIKQNILINKNLCKNIDNCPLKSNSDQDDDNTNGIGNVCELSNYNFNNSNNNDNDNNNSNDKDNDWIIDELDKCPELQETYNWYEDNDWCPELWDNNPCNSEVLWDSFIWFECLQCPCQYAQEASDVNPWDTIRATLRNVSWSILQSWSNIKTL